MWSLKKKKKTFSLQGFLAFRGAPASPHTYPGRGRSVLAEHGVPPSMIQRFSTISSGAFAFPSPWGYGGEEERDNPPRERTCQL